MRSAAITLLLLLSVVSLASFTVTGQTSSSSTALQTATGTQIETRTSTIYSYYEFTQGGQLTQLMAFIIPKAPQGSAGSTMTVEFTAKQGDRVAVRLASSVPTDFAAVMVLGNGSRLFALNLTSVTEFLPTGRNASDPFVIPGSGNWTFMFVNRSHDRDAAILFSAALILGTNTVTQTMSATPTPTSTQGNLITESQTQPTSAITSSQTEGSSSLPYVVGLIIVVALLSLLFYRTGKTKKQR